ncbi:CBS domain-containing protein [Lederbergia citrea]|uniref:CBS domain-containing protein n=1 Tax=Lederbergia citrea TaxID=2833581 RepID=A0A942UMN8_9BACI|nr:CBS domain-containing protein [Lederbergia citrea]MBS4177244.1 CBS domain-containing protein [Lederbergia citrea]MBS4203907.1 CBS domain-containing protein [Lederbergia citrea]MBS4221508.1 CBS domain-containing protein [Lederbergia citrea]
MTQIRDIMTTEVLTCSLKDNVYEVAVKMKDENVGVIPIVDNDRLVGLITDRDIVLRCIAEKNPPSSKVEEIMSSRIVTVTPDTTTQEAARIMAKEQIRRLPVVENGKLSGIVALGDLAVRDLTDDQAKHALSDISEPDETQSFH